MKGFKVLIFSMVWLVVMASCKKELSERERDIIKYDLSEELYKERVNEVGTQLGEYLTDAVSEYAESLRTKLQKEINDYNSATALFGGNAFDIAELFGTSTTEIISRQYEEYVNYANRHLDEIPEITMVIANRLAENPEFLSKLSNGSWDSINLDLFEGINNIPEIITAENMNFGGLSLNESNKVEWGEKIFGDYKKPKLSPEVILYTSVLAIEPISKPKPVYAVYDEENEYWEVGYNSHQALGIKFTQQGDILRYDYRKIKYENELIHSSQNVLNEK